MHEVTPNTGARYQAVRRSAILTLAPLIVNGTIRGVDVLFRRSDDPGGATQSTPKWNPMDRGSIDKVRIRVRVDAICKIALANRIARQGWRIDGDWRHGLGLKRPRQTVQAEAVSPTRARATRTHERVS